MGSASLTSARTSATSARHCVAVCVLLLLLNTFSSLHLSSISLVHAQEKDSSQKEEFSVASLLPSFKTLLFWRQDRSAEDKLPMNGEETTLDHATKYEVSDSESKPVAPVPQEVVSDKVESPIGIAADEEPAILLASMRIPPKKRLLPSSTGNKDNRICHSCGKNELFEDEDEEYRQRIEFIKEQILTRLGMKRPPNLRSQPDIDYSMYMRIAETTINQRELTDMAGQPQDMAEEVDKAFILPTRRDHKAPVFDLSTVNTADPTKVIKAIYILANYNLTEYYYRTMLHDGSDLVITSDPSEDNDISRKAKILQTVSPIRKSHDSFESNSFDSANWYQYDVTAFLSNNTRPTIRIYNENFDILSSVIMVEMTNIKLTRAKRSIDCTDKVSFCCRQHFYVNFTTIGWNNWIFQPPGYNANYCKGKCDLSHARYHHTTVIGKYPAIKLCCSPREMSSISLIYMDDKFNIYQKNLPNMVVESCDCA